MFGDSGHEIMVCTVAAQLSFCLATLSNQLRVWNYKDICEVCVHMSSTTMLWSTKQVTTFRHPIQKVVYLYMVFKMQQGLLTLSEQLQVGHWAEACTSTSVCIHSQHEVEQAGLQEQRHITSSDGHVCHTDLQDLQPYAAAAAGLPYRY